MQRKSPTKTSGSIVMIMTMKMRAHRSSPAKAEAGAVEGVDEGGADHSAAEGGVSAAAADSAADEGSADVAGASVDPGVALTAASLERTAHCARARTAVASSAPSRLSTYSTRPVVSLTLRLMKTLSCICLLHPALTTKL